LAGEDEVNKNLEDDILDGDDEGDKAP